MPDYRAKADYLLRKVDEVQQSLYAAQEAVRLAINDWACAISPFRLGDKVLVLGVPKWRGEVTEVRGAAGVFQITDEVPVIVIGVRYLRKDGQLGKRFDLFYDPQREPVQLQPIIEDTKSC